MGHARTACFVIPCFLFVVVFTARGADDEAPAAGKEVQGKWTRVERTPAGPVTLVKEHKGKNTTLTAFDAQNNVIYSHVSDFTVERPGKVNVLTFTNLRVTAGLNAGRTVPGPVSYVYRVAGDRFVEFRGTHEGDPDPPGVIVWERMK